jgi:hypothetical protein
MPSFRLAVIALLGAATAATAAPVPQPRQRDPLDPKAPAPALAYESAFASYLADQEPKAANWKDSNAAVAVKSGHTEHKH